MLKFGFEQEFFVVDGDDRTPQLVPSGIPNDAGLLAEARGKPHSDPIEAAFSLKAAEERILRKLSHGRQLSDAPVMTIPMEMRLEARREHTKDLIHFQNLYGHKHHPVEAEQMTAGVHVSVTRSRTIRVGDESREVNAMFDFAQFIIHMDERFGGEIEQASRYPGFYEIKGDGRVEYRSLPTNIDILEVAHYLCHITSNIHGSWS